MKNSLIIFEMCISVYFTYLSKMDSFCLEIKEIEHDTNDNYKEMIYIDWENSLVKSNIFP